MGREGARVAQWWEHSPPTNVARVQIPASTPYVGWVCCWFSPLLREVFLRGLRWFSPLLKTNIFKFQFDLERTDTSSCEFFLLPFVGKIGIYKFFLQFTILGGWVKKTKIRRLIYKNHLSFVFATAGGCKFPFGSSFSFSFPLIVITSSCSLLAPGSRRLHFVINFSLLICNILATLYMLNF